MTCRESPRIMRLDQFWSCCVELGLVAPFGMPLKSANRSAIELRACACATLLGLAQQVVDQHLGMHLFLDVERRGVDDEVAPVLLILAAPDELRVEVGIARLAHALRRLLVLGEHRLDIRPSGCSCACRHRA
jgi:hypothetical protein